MVDGKQYILPSHIFMHMYVLDGERIPSPISAWAKTMGGFVSSGNVGEIFSLFSVWTTFKVFDAIFAGIMAY